MGNILSSTPEDSSSLQRNVQGDYSGNSGSNNNFCSGNTTNNNYFNHGSTNPPDNYAEILQCLYTSRYEEHRRRVQEPVEGTCTWVTEHPKFKDWLEKKPSGLLWLSADPGCGKSVTASFLVAHLKMRTDAIVCYFFFKDDSEEQRSATFALCAILHQLFSQRNTLCRYAEEAFRAKGASFAKEVDTLWDILVRAVTEGGCGNLICVVDALDECEEETLASLIRHVTGLAGSQTSDTPLKFLVTSRPYHEIEVELSSPATTIRVKGEDELGAITGDVARVIDDGIRRLESYWEQPGELEYLRDLLKSSADQTFLWVSLVLKTLKKCPDSSPKEFTRIVSTAPRDLAGLYTKILDKSASPEKARRILNIVVAAARPLTLQEMNIAFRITRDCSSVKDLGGLPAGFGKTVKSLCGLFVRVIDSKIYLVHQTAREFLIKSSSSGKGNWQYTLCPKDSNFIMADICVSYLSLEEFENDPFIVAGYDEAKNNPTMPDRYDYLVGGAIDGYVQKYAFLGYAARHWAEHFRDSQDQQMELFEFTRLICEAGSKRFLTWFRVFWFEGHEFTECPQDLTHLMIASWLGQRTVVGRLLEGGGDINARSGRYGTALNLAASQEDEDIARMLLQKNAKAYFWGKEYNIGVLQMKGSELEKEVNKFFEENEELVIFEYDEFFDYYVESLKFLSPNRLGNIGRAFLHP